MTFLVLLSILLCFPATLGLFLRRSDDTMSRARAKRALFGWAFLLVLGWMGLFAFTFLGFGIGGGSPTVLQIATGAFFFTSPLLISAVFTVVSAILLSKGQVTHDDKS